MSKEIEAQVLFIDYDNIMRKLKSMKCEMKFDWTKFRIATFFPCLSLEKQNELYNVIYTRVRDEGKGNVTITTKTNKKTKSEGKFVNEYEISTPNTFEECKDMLLANHLTMKAYQEKLRQKFIIPSRPEIKEIVFDIWPGLPMYMEVEANTEEELGQFLNDLDIDKKNIRYTNAGDIYVEILGITKDKINNNTPELKFSSVKSELNLTDQKFDKILEQQKMYLKLFGFEELIGGRKVRKNSKKTNKKTIKRSSKKASKKASKKTIKRSSKKSSKKSSKNKKN